MSFAGHSQVLLGLNNMFLVFHAAAVGGSGGAFIIFGVFVWKGGVDIVLRITCINLLGFCNKITISGGL